MLSASHCEYPNTQTDECKMLDSAGPKSTKPQLPLLCPPQILQFSFHKDSGPPPPPIWLRNGDICVTSSNQLPSSSNTFTFLLFPLLGGVIGDSFSLYPRLAWSLLCYPHWTWTILCAGVTAGVKLLGVILLQKNERCGLTETGLLFGIYVENSSLI